MINAGNAPQRPQTNATARPTSNGRALSRPGVGETEVDRTPTVQRASVRSINYGAPKSDQFNSFIGQGNAIMNGEVPNKIFNGQSPGRANPNQKSRYAHAKELREFTGF